MPLVIYEPRLFRPRIVRRPGAPRGPPAHPARRARAAGRPPDSPAAACCRRSRRPSATADGTVYFEALSASLNRGWAPLFGVIRDGLKFVDLPSPELYDLGAIRARHEPRRVRSRRSSPRCARGSPIRAAEPSRAARQESAATRERLRRLGYLTGGPPGRRTRTRRKTIRSGSSRWTRCCRRSSSVIWRAISRARSRMRGSWCAGGHPWRWRGSSWRNSSAKPATRPRPWTRCKGRRAQPRQHGAARAAGGRPHAGGTRAGGGGSAGSGRSRADADPDLLTTRALALAGSAATTRRWRRWRAHASATRRTRCCWCTGDRAAHGRSPRRRPRGLRRGGPAEPRRRTRA